MNRSALIAKVCEVRDSDTYLLVNPISPKMEKLMSIHLQKLFQEYEALNAQSPTSAFGIIPQPQVFCL